MSEELKQEDSKELTPEQQEEITSVKLLQAYKMNLELAEKLSLDMSARQLGRVFRALMRAPLEETGKLVDVREKALFEAGMQIMDAKVLLIMNQRASIDAALKETREKAVELEQKDKGE